MITVEVLGAVEAHRDGERLDLPAGKTTELLARLALGAGSRVRADALLDDLWSEPAGRNTLQSKVSQLRRALGDRDLVVGSGDGYLLAVPPAAVDATRVVELAAASAAARAAGDAGAVVTAGRQALALFRGEVLPDAGDWAAPHRTRLEELRLGLVEDVMAARLELGAGAELVAELESLVREQPLREALWACLITALVRAGRQADALAAYGRVRRLLVDELGLEPGPGLRALERQVLRQAPELGAVARVRVPGAGNLPDAERPMVGRVEDVAALVRAVREHRLVTLVGPAGVGKTRLALDGGRRLPAPGAVWLVRLDDVDAGADSGAALGQVVAEALHVPGGERGLPERLGAPGTVLLLDNCEHVAASAAALVSFLLDAVPTLSVLATSQVPLALAAEHVQPVQPLTQQESQALFVQRARELRPQFVLDSDTTPAVAEVCRALDGLPLAIELAAARARSLSVLDIARRLADRFTLLRDPTSRRPARRRALSAAIAWSYDLLFPDDQRGLWALSCFAGSASLDAAEHVLVALEVPASSVLDTVTRLVDRSLVALEPGEAGAVRYRLLDSIRTYAADRLRESGHEHVGRRAHAGWYASDADRAAATVRGPRQPAVLLAARAERANVDAALAWCATGDRTLGVRIALGYGWSWVVLGDGPAGAARVRDALADDTPPADRARGLALAGWLEASAGDLAIAAGDLEEARTLADGALLGAVALSAAFLAIQQGRPDLVAAHAASSVDAARLRDDEWGVAAGLLLGAYGRLMVGDTVGATRSATEALDLLGGIGDSWGLVHAQAMLGGIAHAERRFADAARALERAAVESATLGFPGQAALHRASLARVQQREGDPRAVASCERAIAEATSVGDGRLAATARLTLARLHRAVGDSLAARELLAENARWYRAAGGGELELLNRCLLAAVTDDRAALDGVLLEAERGADPEVQVFALDALARLRTGDDPDGALGLLEESDAIAAGLGHVLDERDRVDAAAARGAYGR